MPPILLLLVIGAAAGFIGTRLMRVTLDVPTTVLLGTLGVGLAWLALRLLMMLSGAVLIAIGAVAATAGLIWLWQRYLKR
jgi:hypothetical protein